MSKPKPWKKPATDHHKGVEVHKAQEAWPQFVREHAVELKEHAEALQKRDMLTDTDEQKRARVRDRDPDRYGRMLRQLEHEKKFLEQMDDPTIYYEGDLRIAKVIKRRSGQQSRLMHVMGITEVEANLILDNLEMFPNLRFIYDFWTNTTRIECDSQDLHVP